MRPIASIVLLLAAALGPAARAVEHQPGQTAVFAGRTELVVLDVVVTNPAGGYAAGLTRDAFTVSENGHARPIEFFSADDAPATVGLVIDDSASMYGMRDLIGVSVRAFADIRHADGEMFGLAFNEHVRPVLPANRPFTDDGELLASQFQQALRTHGRTAVHDAVAAGLDYLARGRHARKVLVLISDGGDNASASTFEQVARAATTSHTVIYTITAADRAASEARPERLRALARMTGGTAQQPRTDRDIQDALERVARDIRSSYIVGYVPSQEGVALRHIKVVVRTADQGRLTARTRTEYMRPPE